jgi:RNA polymerase primary sigma factor
MKGELDFYGRSVLASCEILDSKTEKELAKYIGKRGEKAGEARERLIGSSLKLVVKIANDFVGLGLDLQDLISEGNIGLMKAVDRFKPSKGARLSYYASFWIRQSIMRALSNKGRTIRLPVGATTVYLNILKFKKKYAETHEGVTPDISLIAKKLKVSRKRVIDLEEGGANTLSVNAPVLGDSPSPEEFGSTLTDEKSPIPDKIAQIRSDILLLKEHIGKLPKREQKIMEYRFGMHGDKPKTLEKIGVEFKISRERVRQLETRAMKKLKFLFRREIKA